MPRSLGDLVAVSLSLLNLSRPHLKRIGAVGELSELYAKLLPLHLSEQEVFTDSELALIESVLMDHQMLVDLEQRKFGWTATLRNRWSQLEDDLLTLRQHLIKERYPHWRNVKLVRDYHKYCLR